ncbi:TolC family protein [Sulfurospirillum sp.]|uniref:TolC family protein n=1 Tax=Sulfurospirillum sp. TaxID=2053622 RepID=UPI002FDE82EB
MRLLLLFLLPLCLYAQTYTELLNLLEKSNSYKSAKELENASESLYQAAQGKNLPSLDATLSAIEFNEISTMTLHLPSFPVTTANMGTRKHMEGALVLSYPLFTGFAISAAIDKAKFEHEQATLKVTNLKRNLAMHVTQLFSTIIAEDKVIDALKSSELAINQAYKKAKGFYDNGLLAQSELYAIEAKKYDIEAQLLHHRNQKKQLLNQLSLIVNTKIETLSSNTLQVFELPNDTATKEMALNEREDLHVMAKAIDVAQSSVELAKSKNYPTLAMVGVLKRQGDSLELNGDGYTNADKSYVGLSASWNLFNGYSDAHNIDAARASKMSAFFNLEEYKQQVSLEVENTQLEIRTVQAQLQSALLEEKASESYTKLTQGRFDNQLISADELSRAIANLASTKAKVATLQSELFNQSARLWLECGWSVFEKKALTQH